MENLNFYSALDGFGAEVFVLAIFVSAIIAIVKKIFPKMGKRNELFIRFALAVGLYALYVTLLEKDVALCLEKGASICGVSYFIRTIFSGEAGDEIIDEVINAAIPKAKLTKKQLKEIRSKTTEEEIRDALQKAANGRITETKLNVLAKTVYQIKTRTEKV